jgi:hypothetical protein
MALKRGPGGSNQIPMTSSAGARRRWTVLALTGAAGFVVVGTSPAFAAGSLSAPSGTVTSQSPVSVTATGGSCGGTLTVTGAGGYSKSTSTTSNGGSMSITVDPNSEANGGYQAKLTTKTKQLTGCSTDSSQPTKSWTLQVAPSTPSSVKAQLTGDRQITVSWDESSGSDLKNYGKYGVYDGSSGDLKVTMNARDTNFCDSSNSCGVVFPYSQNTYGPQSFQVVAMRTDGSGGYVESNKSNTVSATLPPPPTPDPTQPPGGGGTGGGGGGGGTGGGGGGGTGGGGGGTGGTGGGGTGTGGGTTGTGSGSGGVGLGSGVRSSLTFSASSGNVILPPAPPPAIAAPGNLSPVIGGLPDGPYQETLPYGAHAASGDTKHHNVATRTFYTVTDAFHGARLMRSLAIAFLLLLAGAHLRVWLRRPVV